MYVFSRNIHCILWGILEASSHGYLWLEPHTVNEVIANMSVGHGPLSWLWPDGVSGGVHPLFPLSLPYDESRSQNLACTRSIM